MATLNKTELLAMKKVIDDLEAIPQFVALSDQAKTAVLNWSIAEAMRLSSNRTSDKSGDIG